MGTKAFLAGCIAFRAPHALPITKYHKLKRPDDYLKPHAKPENARAAPVRVDSLQYTRKYSNTIKITENVLL